MTGVIYARYSSDNQREESIEGQLRECMAFADKNDIHIIGTYIDRAYSAKTDNRPEFQRMIKDSSKCLFDTVIVWKLDRFARNRYDAAYYKNALKKNKVRVVSAMENISDTPEGILMEAMLEGYAEYYSAELAQKVTRGMTENALKCRHNGGALPIGYTVDDEMHYQIDPTVAPVIVEAFERYASGSTMKEVTAFLNTSGITTVRGNQVTINMTTRMLHNRKYIGEYSFKDIVVPNGIPAIVSQDLFDRVQARMERTKRAPSQHKAEDDYILTTKLRCGKCRCFMVGESGRSHSSRESYKYYKCVSAKHRRGCDKKAVRKEWIEDLVIDQIKRLIFDDELISCLADMLVEELGKESTVLPNLKKELAQTETAIGNMLYAIQSGIITPSTKQRLEELEERKSSIETMIIQEEMAKPVIGHDIFVSWLNRFREYDLSDKEQRQRLVDHFVNVIYLYDDRMDIFLNFRDGAVSIEFDAKMWKAGKRQKNGDTKSSDLTSSGSPNSNNPNFVIIGDAFGFSVYFDYDRYERR